MAQPLSDGAEAPDELGPRPAAYVRILWFEDRMGHVDVPLYPKMTYRDLRLIVSETKGWLPFYFALSDTEGALLSLDESVTEGRDVLCQFGGSGYSKAAGPYLRESDSSIISIFRLCMPFPVKVVARLIEVAVAQISLRRVALLHQPSPLPFWDQVVLNTRTEGLGSLFRFGASTICWEAVMQVANGILGPRPPLIALKGNLLVETLSTAFTRAIFSAPEYLFRSILVLQYESTLAPSSTAAQFFRLPLVSLSDLVHITARYPYALARQMLFHIMMQIGNSKRVQSALSARLRPGARYCLARAAHVLAKSLVIQPLLTVERYSLITRAPYLDAFRSLSARQMLFSQCVDSAFAYLSNLVFDKLSVRMQGAHQTWRLEALEHKEDRAMVRALANEALVTFGVITAASAAGILLFWRKNNALPATT